MSTEVKLFGFWCSPFSFRVEWALKLKGVHYDYFEEDVFNKSSTLLELNPVHKKVPVLVHDNKVISESFVILEYVDETWEQNPLLPKDPYERAVARFWAKFAEEKLLNAAWTAMWSKGETKEKAVKDSIVTFSSARFWAKFAEEKLLEAAWAVMWSKGELKEALKESIEALEKIEGALTEKKQFEGESIGYLDLAIGWIAHWLPVLEEVGSVQILNPEKFPVITDWMAKFLSHPVIKDNLPHRDKMCAYFEEQRETRYKYYTKVEIPETIPKFAPGVDK